jgi:hypothetical protein
MPGIILLTLQIDPNGVVTQMACAVDFTTKRASKNTGRVLYDNVAPHKPTPQVLCAKVEVPRTIQCNGSTAWEASPGVEIQWVVDPNDAFHQPYKNLGNVAPVGEAPLMHLQSVGAGDDLGLKILDTHSVEGTKTPYTMVITTHFNHETKPKDELIYTANWKAGDKDVREWTLRDVWDNMDYSKKYPNMNWERFLDVDETHLTWTVHTAVPAAVPEEVPEEDTGCFVNHDTPVPVVPKTPLVGKRIHGLLLTHPGGKIDPATVYEQLYTGTAPVAEAEAEASMELD